MNLDFSFAKYKELCEVMAKSEYTPLTVKKYLLLNDKTDPFIIIRHDVDSQPEYALKMAKLENELGIASTYYFRYIEGIFLPDLIKKIVDLGHEIGYHYEVLDKASGNPDEAIKIFEMELNKFRQFFDVRTIAQHGSPLIGALSASSLLGIYGIAKNALRGKSIFTHLVNIDIWKKYDFKDFGIIGEAYLSINFNEVVYFSDTGRSWNSIFRMKDFVNGPNNFHSKIKHTDDLIKVIKNKDITRMCILVHANQWKENFGEWLRWLMFQHVRNMGKLGLKLYKKIYIRKNK